MEKKDLKEFLNKPLFAPKGAVLGSQERAEQVSDADKKRVRDIAIKVIEILAENNVTVKEVPRVTAAVLAILNMKLDNAEVDKVVREL